MVSDLQARFSSGFGDRDAGHGDLEFLPVVFNVEVTGAEAEDCYFGAFVEAGRQWIAA